jgi:S-adenosylmethionine hydrolase
MITLTTDIGDEYAAQMKARIYSMNPNARIVDVSHNIAPQNIRAGAFVLMTTLPQFPPCVHVCVIDPGVGSERRGRIFKCNDHVLVGPDNGVLVPAARALGLDEAYAIDPSYFTNASATFHGRDVFAPIAARIDAQERASKFGQLVDSYVDLDFGTPSTSKDRIECEVIYIDRFGNVVTNVPSELFLKDFKFGDRLKVSSNRYSVLATVAGTYSNGKGLLIIPSSSGYIELAENLGNAAKRSKMASGLKIVINRERGHLSSSPRIDR